VRAQTKIKKDAILVPNAQSLSLQGSYQISIVDNQNKAHLVPVKVGEEIGQNWIIEEGLHPATVFVLEGIEKAKEGALVKPKPFAPQNQTNSPATNQPAAR